MKILYISFTNLSYTLNSVYLNGLRENGVELECVKIGSKGIKGHLEALKFYRLNGKNCDFVMIGYDSPTLAVFLRPFCRKKLIFNAVLPVYERMITSRNLANHWSIKGLYYWLVDFLAFHFSDLVMLETKKQADFVSNFYFVDNKKLFRAWIGVDDKNFFYEPSIPKSPVFTVIFRGAFLPEAGTKYVIEAAKILENENINFIIIGGGLLKNEILDLAQKLKPANLKLITDFVSYEELRAIMQGCHLSLGQLSDHPRLARTIPNKAYESLAMKLPYLTAINDGILELLSPDKTCLVCDPANASSLAKAILLARGNYSFVEKIAENSYKFYQSELRPNILTKILLHRIKSI